MRRLIGLFSFVFITIATMIIGGGMVIKPVFVGLAHV